jgi:hypothetical protein
MGFKANYPDHGKIRSCLATNQRCILINMLQALIKTEAAVTNILKVGHYNQQWGEQFFQGLAQTFNSITEQTIDKYAGSKGAKPSGGKQPGRGKLKCFGCNGPHPCSRKDNREWKVICPNALNQCVAEKAQSEISKFQACRKKKQQEHKKWKNVNTINWEDIPTECQEVILQQQYSLMSVVVSKGTPSVGSSVTNATGTAHPTTRSSVTLHQITIVLASSNSKPPIPISIHSPMAHIILKTGLSMEKRESLSLK